ASDVSCAGASAGEPADSACDGDCSGCWTSSVPSVPSAWVGRGLRRPATFGRRAGVGAGPAGCGVGLRRFGGTNGTPILRDYCWPAPATGTSPICDTFHGASSPWRESWISSRIVLVPSSLPRCTFVLAAATALALPSRVLSSLTAMSCTVVV